MMLASLSVMLVGALLNVDAASLLYYDPPPAERESLAYRVRGAGSIPRELGEKLLVREVLRSDGVSPGISTLVVVVNKDYPRVQQEIRAIVAEKSGIQEEHDNQTGPIPRAPEERAPYLGIDYPPWPELGQGLALLREGASARPTREFELLSQPYNRLEALKGFSEVRIRVTDGKLLFGKDITILQIRRRDYSRERARFHHALPIPLPWKEDRAFTLVTNTEVALVEQLTKRIPRVVLRYFVPTPPSLDINRGHRENVLAKMRDAIAQFGAE